MNDVRTQYFLSYGVIGTTMPFASVFFRQCGFTDAQVAYAWAIWSAAFVLAPVLITLAADTRVDPRRLMVFGLTVSALTLALLGVVRGIGVIYLVWVVHCLASLPLLGLQDGICFSLQQRQRERGETVVPFHKLRVWGTLGFMLPSVVIFFLLRNGMTVRGAIVSGAAFALLAAIQATQLHDPRPAGRSAAQLGPRRLPTLGALAAFAKPLLLVFCLCIFLSQMASTIYATFYPIYLTNQAHIPAEWVGLVSNIGVTVEIVFVWGCGWLMARFGIRGLLLAGLAGVAVRMSLLALWRNPFVGIATQFIHGLQVVSLGIMPQTFIDQQATDQYRHSMQGVFVMLNGFGRVAGTLSVSFVAAYGSQAIFGYAAGLAALAGVLAAFAFWPKRDAPTASEPEAAVVGPMEPETA